MSYIINIFFGENANFPIKKWDSFVKTCLEIQGADNLMLSKKLDLDRKDEIFEAVIKSKNTWAEGNNDPIYLRISLLNNSIFYCSNKRTVKYKWIFSVEEIGGGGIKFWSAFFSIPGIFVRYFPDSIMDDPSDDILIDNLENYLLLAGQHIREILGNKLVDQSDILNPDDSFKLIWPGTGLKPFSNRL